MPGGDRTGPAGQGPMTGRAAGYCAGYPAAGYGNFGFGRGDWGGWGRGGGRGRRNRFYATGLPGWQRPALGWPGWASPYGAPFASGPTQEQELDSLKDQAEYFESALDGIRKRIEELEAGSKQEK